MCMFGQIAKSRGPGLEISGFQAHRTPPSSTSFWIASWAKELWKVEVDGHFLQGKDGRDNITVGLQLDAS